MYIGKKIQLSQIVAQQIWSPKNVSEKLTYQRIHLELVRYKKGIKRRIRRFHRNFSPISSPCKAIIKTNLT